MNTFNMHAKSMLLKKYLHIPHMHNSEEEKTFVSFIEILHTHKVIISSFR